MFEEQESEGCDFRGFLFVVWIKDERRKGICVRGVVCVTAFQRRNKGG